MTTLEKAARTPSEEALAALIKPLWLTTKPGQPAQRIRSELSVALDDPQFSQWAADYIPEYVWDLLDIAAQRGIDSLSSALLDPSDEVAEAAAAEMFEEDPAYRDSAGHRRWRWDGADDSTKMYWRRKAISALRAAGVKITDQ